MQPNHDESDHLGAREGSPEGPVGVLEHGGPSPASVREEPRRTGAGVGAWVPGGPGQWWVTLLGVLAVAAGVWLVVWVSAAHLPRVGELFPPDPSFPGGAAFEGWARWDAYWYRSIAEDGYSYYPGVQSSIAFFPAYPIVLMAVGGLFPSTFVAGTVVSLVAGAAALVLFRRWAGLFLSRPAATTALALLALYPYAYYLYGAVYADALFLAASIAAFLALERDHVALAALLGAVAGVSRPAGGVVALVLVLRLLERRTEGATTWRQRLDVRRLRRRDWVIFGAFSGVLAWVAYLAVRFGDPMAFSSVQSARGWDQPAGPSTWLKFGFFRNVTSNLGSSYTWSIVASAAFTALVVVLALTIVRRRMGWAYALYCLLIAAMVLEGTKDFMGAGRYAFAAFPAFAAAGGWLAERRTARWVVPTLFGVGMVVTASAFARGSYLT